MTNAITHEITGRPIGNGLSLAERKLWIWRAMLCGTGAAATMTGIAGIGITIIWLAVPTDTVLRTTGTILVTAFFPLLLLAAHCLDRIEAVEKDLKKNTMLSRDDDGFRPGELRKVLRVDGIDAAYAADDLHDILS